VIFPAATCDIKDLPERRESRPHKTVTLHGYLGSLRNAGKSLTFVELSNTDLTHSVQLVAHSKDHDDPNSVLAQLRSLDSNAPVAITGTVKSRVAKPNEARDSPSGIIPVSDLEISIAEIVPLNEFPKDIIIAEGTNIPPHQRHLQIRQDKNLRDALLLRSRAYSIIRKEMVQTMRFAEIETPLLFKSTPEGAREFLVPTRTAGEAYALPQSPQQYKQILMASGVSKYVQFAKCFRDEDLRADRQPEFTQLDLEMAFSTGEDVMKVVEALVKKLWRNLLDLDTTSEAFPRMSYQHAMSMYGSDKPDLRLGSEIKRIQYMLPVDLVRMISDLEEPIVEVMKVPIAEDPKETRRFVTGFMDSAEAKQFNKNPDGQPGIFVYDSRKPLGGLQAFGFEAAEQVEEALELEEGDLVVLQARKDAPFAGGSTMMGNLRLALHKSAVSQGFKPRPSGFKFLWVNDFPLFKPSDLDVSEPGQGGTAGLSSTHHPFTAPKTPADVDLLLTNPLECVADHYDLVVNGVELGGGSRRIHQHAMQELVLRDVLGMSNERLEDFRHLIEVLRAGCPPHAGMALGFDRLMAVMLGKDSVRDVIAFPKSGKGEDVMVKSPSKMTKQQLETYHLRLREEHKGVDEKGM